MQPLTSIRRSLLACLIRNAGFTSNEHGQVKGLPSSWLRDQSAVPALTSSAISTPCGRHLFRATLDLTSLSGMLSMCWYSKNEMDTACLHGEKYLCTCFGTASGLIRHTHTHSCFSPLPLSCAWLGSPVPPVTPPAVPIFTLCAALPQNCEYERHTAHGTRHTTHDTRASKGQKAARQRVALGPSHNPQEGSHTCKWQDWQQNGHQGSHRTTHSPAWHAHSFYSTSPPTLSCTSELPVQFQRTFRPHTHTYTASRNAPLPHARTRAGGVLALSTTAHTAHTLNRAP